MDYPKSVPGVGLQHGQFVDEDIAQGLIGSLIPAEWGNSVTDELLNVVRASGLEPDEKNKGQILKALDQLYARLDSPTFSGQPQAPTPAIKEVNTRLATTQYVADYVRKELLIMAVSQVAYFAMANAPAGWLKLNGACVLRSVYSALDQAIYCGNEDNPTAIYGYRCVDAQRPNDTRSVNGDYLVLPDLRGEFIRSWDDGRGVDPNRFLRRLQGHALQKHGHSVNDPGHDHGTDEGEGHDHIYVKASGAYGHGGDAPFCLADTFDARTTKNRTGLKVLRNTTGISILETGDTETRPRNVAMLACIKY